MHGLWLSSKCMLLHSRTRAVEYFTISLFAFWCFKDFKQCYNYNESETQHGTWDKGRIINIDESKESEPNNFANINNENLPNGTTKRKEKSQRFGTLNRRIVQQLHPVSIVTRLQGGEPGIRSSISGRSKIVCLLQMAPTDCHSLLCNVWLGLLRWAKGSQSFKQTIHFNLVLIVRMSAA
jgi:hypothetical protein